MSQALYRKYRPKGWDQVMGQGHVVQTLRNAIRKDRVGHAYLFAGPRGTGKTTVARILAKAVNCLAEDPGQRPCNECNHCGAVNENRFLDLIEMDAASNTGVEDVRELRDKIGFSPSQGRFKVYIIDEVHMLSTPAFNALLKTLEEPPPHVIFVLATTEIHKIPATVLSRCQRHEFRRVSVGEIVANLRSIVASEGWQANDDALVMIARQATGSVRDAQSLLDQLASAGPEITLELAQPVLGTATSQAVLDIVESIRDRQSAVGLERLRVALDSGVDPRTLARQIIEYLRGLMLIQLGNPDRVEATKEVREAMKVHAAAFLAARVLRMMKAFNAAAADTRGGWQPSLALELALAESFEPEADPGRSNPAPSGGGARAPLAGSMASGRKGSSPSAPRNAGAAQNTGDSGPTTLHQTADHVAPHAEPNIEASSITSGDVPAGQPPPSIDLADVVRGWKEIRGALKRNHPAVDGLLNSCKPVEVLGDELFLGFQSDAVRAIMDRPENMEAARKAIAAVLGHAVRLRCVVINARGKVPPNMPQDGMVATALNQGGEIVDLQE
ncbi:MAG: DNA polymerase III subunit gamma/tau [Chloroflexota bacterium]